MNNIALLNGNIVLYWDHIIAVLGILAGFVLVFALRPFTFIKVKAVLWWSVLTLVLSFILSKLIYYYCRPEHFSSFGTAVTGLFDHHYNVMGLIFGAMLSALIIKKLHLAKNLGNILDTTFPGVILTIAVIRLGYLFADTFHSTILIKSPVFQIPPFAVSTTDTAGNTSFVLAPFLLSFLILLVAVLIIVLFVRNTLRCSGDLFRMVFLFFALTEMVLESTRYDALGLHFFLLSFLNPYVGFISTTMVLCAICLLVMFLVYFFKTIKISECRKSIILLAAFGICFAGFGVCEYLVQRYTTQTVLFHWLQVFCAVVIAACFVTLIIFKNTKGKKVPKVFEKLFALLSLK